MALWLTFPIAILCLFSCKGHITFNDTHSSKMGSHDVTIKPGDSMTSSSSMTSGSNSQYTLECGGTSISIDNEALTVNGAYYGTLKPKETILIENGVVSVAGVERKPLSTPASQSATPDKAKPIPEL